MKRICNACAALGRLPIRKFICTGMVMVLAIVQSTPPVLAENNDTSSLVTVLISRHIKPYMEASQGLQEALAQKGIEVQEAHILEQEKPKLLAATESDPEQNHVYVAIGPEALSTLDQMARDNQVQGVYCMVLDPGQLASEPELLSCGLNLNLSPLTQLQNIQKALPQAKEVGLLFNPEQNWDFFQQARFVQDVLDLQIKPLEVSSSEEIPDVLQASWEGIDALWIIPDKTVISRTLVQYIIREAVYAKKPVVGYNRFFYESGAAVAYAFDYQEIGRRTARLVEDRLKGLPCGSVSPAYELLINNKVMQRLDLQSAEEQP